MPSHRRRSLMLALGLTVLLGGCALPWQQARGPQPLADAQQVFRPLMIGVKNGDLDSFDPARIQFYGDYTLAQLVFPPLVTLDDHNQVVPWAAERWEPSADGLTWTFHLLANMRWSDGVPIDASTYAYSLNRSLDPCTASGVGYYLSGTGPELIAGSVAFNDGVCPRGVLTSPETLIGKSILVPDPQTLVLHLSHPAAYFPASLTYSTAWAQPRQLIERYGATVDTNGNITFHWTEHLVGFGGNLFTVKRWDQAGHFDVVRNEAFWGQKPRLREIDVSLYKDLDIEWAAYQKGQGDYVSSPPSANLAAANAMPGYHADPDLTVLYLSPNWAVPPFDDVRVRQAFDLALDRRANGRLLAYPAIAPSIHMVPQGMPGYNPNLADPEGRVGEAALDPDIARARVLWLAYVRERWGGDASKAPNVVYRNCGSSRAAAIAAEYVREWQTAMPGVQVVPQDCHAGIQVRIAPRLQLASAGWLMDYPDPQDFLSLLVHTGSPYNQTSISVPTADVLMDAADINPDQAQRLAQYQRAEQLLVNEVAWIPTGQTVNVYLVRPRVAGDYHERASQTTALAVWQRICIVKG